MNYNVELLEGKQLKLYFNDKVYNPHFSSTDVTAIANQFIMPGVTVLDVACGSGLTGLALKKMHPETLVELCDIDDEAVRITKLNAKRNGLKVKVFKQDLFPENSAYHLVTANLPTYDANQMREEQLHGPEVAYTGGDNGLELYTRLLKSLKGRPGLLVCEIQPKRQTELLRLCEELGYVVLVRIGDAFAFTCPSQ